MKKIFAISAIALLSLFSVSKASAQDGYIGEIRMFAGNFAPKNWAFCQGQILAIQSNTALFSILLTTYGGNGTTNFALPNLSGRVAVGQGQAPGLSSYPQGEMGGFESVTLTANQMPAHSHAVAATMGCYDGAGNVDTPVGNYPAKIDARGYEYCTSANAIMAPFSWTVGTAGSNQPHENRQKSYGINYIICLQGIYPSRQ